MATVCSPDAMPARRNTPPRSVEASDRLPVATIFAPGNGSPVAASTTRPSIAPVDGCARSGAVNARTKDMRIETLEIRMHAFIQSGCHIRVSFALRSFYVAVLASLQALGTVREHSQIHAQEDPDADRRPQ